MERCRKLGFRGVWLNAMPSVGAALRRAVKWLLLDGVFFMPKRRVAIEFVEPDDFPRTGSRTEINTYLERFYNARPEKNTYVPYAWWQRHGVQERPDPVLARRTASAASVALATRELVLGHLKEVSGRSDVTLDHQLGSDLGLDSLATAELVAWVQTEFGFSVGTPESLCTAADEADAGDDALDHPRHAVRRMDEQMLACLNEPATCQRHERKGPQARAACPPLAIPADRDGQRESDPQREQMRPDLQLVHDGAPSGPFDERPPLQRQTWEAAAKFRAVPACLPGAASISRALTPAALPSASSGFRCAGSFPPDPA
jgi:acyl carrier protein